MPFNLLGILLEDKHIEVVERDDFAQVFGKNTGQFLRFATRGECLRDANQRFKALTISSQSELWFRFIHFTHFAIPVILPGAFFNRRDDPFR
jgi:hypothetical protein